MKVIVVGGGASGLFRAMFRANNGHEVTVIERASSCGKKLLVTGNGKCNYYNSDQDILHYHSNEADKISKIINTNNLNILKDAYASIGIVPFIKDGYWYPHSQQAVNILNILKRNCDALNVKFIYDTEISNISKQGKKFILNNEFYADKVIICTGSGAYYKKEKCLTYDILKALGHKIYDIKPALVQMTSNDKILKAISGVRVNGEISLCENNNIIRTTTGEIQFTDYGISGICTMILSREYKSKTYVKINLIPDLAKNSNEFKKFFINYGKLSNCTVGDILDSIINYKLSNAICNRLKIPSNTMFNRLNKAQIDQISNEMTAFCLNLSGTKGFEFAQTVSGGVSLSDIDTNTMESKIVKGLYICGEALDLDGDCGGYNLTIAFLTGLLAGSNI